MKNLMIRKHVLCVLVGIVMVLGVVGVVDAITRLERRSPERISVRLNDTFEIKFSATLQSPLLIKNLNNDYMLEDQTTRVNSSGYKIETSSGNGRDYILPDSTYTVPTAGDNPTAIVGTQHRYRYVTGNANTENTFLSPEGTYYVDTSGNVIDSKGRAVYIRTRTGMRADTATSQADTYYMYERAKTAPPTKQSDSSRYYYNDEKIMITSTLDLRLPNGFPVHGRAISETDHVDSRLKNSMTLTGRASSAGTVEITISDDTPATDYPTGSLAKTLAGLTPREPRITFTVNVSELATATAGRLRTTRDIESVSDQFKVEGALTIDDTTVPENTDVIYRVTRGSGTLYYDERVAATTALTVNRDFDVYINMNGTDNTVEASITGEDHIVKRQSVVFEYIGSGAVRNPTPSRDPTPPAPTQRSITVSTTSQSAAPGQTVTVTAQLSDGASGTIVTFRAVGGVFTQPSASTQNGRAQSSLIVQSGVSSVTINADAGSAYRQGSATITVSGAAPADTTPSEPEVLEPDSIEIYDGDDQQGEIGRTLDDDLEVRVVDRNGDGVPFVRVQFDTTEGSGRFAPSDRRVTDNGGYANVRFTPRSEGDIEVEAAVDGLRSVYFTITTGEPPDAIKKISGDNQSDRPGERLAKPFVVEVVDENDDPVSGVTVTFSVTAGDGTLSATSATTNGTGRAQTTLRLGDAVGDNTVTASVSGVSDRITFTASAGATVLIDASNRAPLYWIDKQNGTLHRLVDDEVENLASNVKGVTSFAVDATNGLLYWGVQVGRNGGKIQRSRLNGKNVQVLKDKLTSVPMGLALDASGSTIYWTSASGKIRSMATEGSARVTKIVENLSDPTALAVSNGYLYWAEPLGRVRRVSLTADRKTAVNIATGLGEPVGIAIAKGKIYWIERSNGGGGALQRANLNGTQIEELKALTGGVPLGIAVDASDNKIYWTKLSKIQRTNLTGRSVTDVVTGLSRPGAIALGVVSSAPTVRQTAQTTRTTQTTQTTTPTTYSKYDINKDGAVNNRDTKLVAAAVGQSGAAITNPRTDVDGSGTVDVTDLILVIANLDDDVAAPAIDVDFKAMDLDFDRVQEQVEVLLASGDRSHAAQRALLYLQHVLASARPDATALLANYPNPFNPETWIPYHLAESADVKINIYDARGTLVRALSVGHQTAGYYTSRSRAAYWDGRNALGERVASGIYFYQLQADAVSPMRKMVILK